MTKFGTWVIITKNNCHVLYLLRILYKKFDSKSQSLTCLTEERVMTFVARKSRPFLAPQLAESTGTSKSIV